MNSKVMRGIIKRGRIKEGASIDPINSSRISWMKTQKLLKFTPTTSSLPNSIPKNIKERQRTI